MNEWMNEWLKYPMHDRQIGYFTFYGKKYFDVETINQ